MCVIGICEKNNFPDKHTLKLCEKQNDHGAGIAWKESGVVCYEKGLTAKQIYKRINRGIGDQAVIHFRLKSVGDKIKELCHPFPITKEAELNLKGTCERALFHNGTWYSWNDRLETAFYSGKIPKIPKGEFSDSRAMALLCAYYGDDIFRFMSGQKITILGSDGIKKYGDGWITHKKVTYSNDYFLPSENDSEKYYHNCDICKKWHKGKCEAKMPIVLSSTCGVCGDTPCTCLARWKNSHRQCKACFCQPCICQFDDPKEKLDALYEKLALSTDSAEISEIQNQINEIELIENVITNNEAYNKFMHPTQNPWMDY